MTGAEAWSAGGCHCGRIRFEARGRPIRVFVCNCSICTRKGYLHWIVPRDDVRVLAGADDLVEYRFGTGVARHLFCPVCACAPFYVPRSDPDKLDVNARCLDDISLAGLEQVPFDGQDWERTYERYRRVERGDP